MEPLSESVVVFQSDAGDACVCSTDGVVERLISFVVVTKMKEVFEEVIL